MAQHSLNFLISAKMKEGKSEIEAVKRSLKELGYELVNVQEKTNKLGETKITATYMDGLKKVTRTWNDQGQVIKNTATQQKRAWDTGRLLWYFNILRMVGNKFANIETSAMDFNETIEKFNVSMGTAAEKAQLFQDRMANAIGTSRAELMNYQANFKNIMAGLGTMSTETAEKISESLTKMSLDYSSLFNTSQASAANKIQAALVGTIMPIRRESGYDVSRNAVQTKANELGLNRTYAQLNETEKRLIRIMLLMDQMKNTGAFNDLARTIESPANQIKVLKNQVQELGVWLGNVFMGTIGRILPYINGFIMALKEIVKLFAIFVGYEPIGTEITQPLEEAADNVDDIGTGLGRASSHAKELKKQLQGFDVLNVITTPATSSGGGGSGVGGVDPALLGALQDYDSLMENVRMKAADIRDAIMNWLGFFSEDGGLTWHLREGETNFRKILDIAKELGTILLGYKLSKSALNLINLLTGGGMSAGVIKMKAAGVSLMLGGLSLIWMGISHVIEDGDLSAWDLLEILSGGAMTFIGGMMTFGKGVSMKMALGLTMSIAGITLVYGSIKKMIEGDFSPETILEAIGGSALTVVGGILTFKSILNLNLGSISAGNIKDKIAGAVGGATGTAKGATEQLSRQKGFKLPDIKTILKGLADFALIVGGVVGVILALGAIMQIPGVQNTVQLGITVVKDVFSGIGEVILPIAAVGAAMYLLGGHAKILNMLKGFADIALVLDGVPLLITALGGLMSIPGWHDAATKGIDVVKKIFAGIGEVIAPLATVGAAIVALGFATPLTVLSGLAGLAIIIGGTELIAIALGALSDIPGNKETLQKGFEILNIIGKGIGEFIGNFVGGIISGTLSFMETLGTQLSKFMINAQPFFEGIRDINEESTKGVNAIVDVILKLTGARILNSLTSWFTGGLNLAEFGTELAIFGVYFKAYADVIKDVDTDVVIASATAATALAEMADKLPNQGGLVSWFAGDNTLADWAPQLIPFGVAMKVYSQVIQGLDAALVKESAYAAMALAEMADKLPNQGGLVSWFAGDNKIGDWGMQLPYFGVFLKAYSDAIQGIDATLIKESATAALSLAELASKLPDYGGLVSFFAGDNRMDAWGMQLVWFGTFLKAYGNEIQGLNANAITESATAAKALSEVANNIPNTGGIVSAIAGDNRIDVWGMQLVYFGAFLKLYSEKVAGINADVVTESAYAAYSLAVLADNLPDSGGLVSLFAGDNSIDNFGLRLALFGGYFREYYNQIKGIGFEQIDRVNSALNHIIGLYKYVKDNGIVSVIDDFKNKLKDSAGSLKEYVKNSLSDNDAWWIGYSFGQNIGWGVNAGIRDKIKTTIQAFDTDNWNKVKEYSIRAYARGGLPNMGEMFIAREQGPELVGQIGGQTAVMNNDQIVAAVSQGVANAVASVMGSQGGSFNLYIDGEQITDVVQKRISRNANIYGR